MNFLEATSGRGFGVPVMFGTVIEPASKDSPDKVQVRVDSIHGPDIKNADVPLATILGTNDGGSVGIGERAELIRGTRVLIIYTDPPLYQIGIILGTIGQVHRSLPAAESHINNQSVLTITPVEGQKFQNKNTLAFREANVPVGKTTLEYRKKVAWEFFSRKHTDYKPHIIAGIMGNLIVESKLDPTEFQDLEDFNDARAVGRGIAQWDSSDGHRWDKLRIFARTRNVSEFDLLLQLEFIHHELTSYESYSGDQALFRTTNVTEAAILFMRYYERPAIKKTKSKYIGFAFDIPGFKFHEREGEDRRVKLAQAVLGEFIQVG